MNCGEMTYRGIRIVSDTLVEPGKMLSWTAKTIEEPAPDSRWARAFLRGARNVEGAWVALHPRDFEALRLSLEAELLDGRPAEHDVRADGKPEPPEGLAEPQ